MKAKKITKTDIGKAKLKGQMLGFVFEMLQKCELACLESVVKGQVRQDEALEATKEVIEFLYNSHKSVIKEIK